VRAAVSTFGADIISVPTGRDGDGGLINDAGSTSRAFRWYRAFPSSAAVQRPGLKNNPPICCSSPRVVERKDIGLVIDDLRRAWNAGPDVPVQGRPSRSRPMTPQLICRRRPDPWATPALQSVAKLRQFAEIQQNVADT
jgi:hypothetical protein